MLHPTFRDLVGLFVGVALGASLALSLLAVRMLALARDACNRAAREASRLASLSEAIMVYRVDGQPVERMRVVKDKRGG